MADDEHEFRHESLQDPQSIVAYLEALTAGIQSGAVALKDPEGEINLSPRGLIQFQVRASKKRDRRRLTLKFSWKEESAEDQSSGALTIEGRRSDDDED